MATTTRAALQTAHPAPAATPAGAGSERTGTRTPGTKTAAALIRWRRMRVVTVRGHAAAAAAVGSRSRSVPVLLRLLLLLGQCATGTGSPAGAAPPGQAPAQTPRTAPLAYGFQGEFFETASRPLAIAAIREAGFGWAKQQVRWEDYEIQAAECASLGADCLEEVLGGRLKYFRRGPVGFLDALVGELNGSGLRVLLSVVRSPAFYAAPGGHAPADPGHLRDFLFFLAGRYRGRVQAIEPWNEQNLSWEWGGARLWPNAPAAPPQGAVEFVALQRAAYEGIKRADPSITVVLPALTPTGLGECWLDPQARPHAFCVEQVQIAIDDGLYLDFMYQVGGGEIRNFYDVLGVHPSGYNNPPDDWLDTATVAGTSFKGHGSFYVRRYEQLREVQRKHGDTKPMWFTEVGWSVAPRPAPGYEYARDNTEEARGAYVARLLEQVHAEAPYVTNIFLWNLNFRALVPETDEKHGFGVLNADWSRTPAYACAADFVRSGNRITRAECRRTSAAGAAVPTHTQVPVATETPTALPPTPVPSSTATPTALPTATPTPTAAATTTPAEIATPSPSSIATVPASVTATHTPTPAPSAAPAASVTPAHLPAAPPPATQEPERTAVLTAGERRAAALPARVQETTGAPSSSVLAAGVPAPAPSNQAQREHTVVKGDTLFSIARRNGATVDALVAANGLGSRDAVLAIGRTLVVPSATVPPTGSPSATPRTVTRGEHTVVKGDTLFSIARRANTSVDALLAANRLGAPDALLHVGRRLVLP